MFRVYKYDALGEGIKSHICGIVALFQGLLESRAVVVDSRFHFYEVQYLFISLITLPVCSYINNKRLLEGVFLCKER